MRRITALAILVGAVTFAVVVGQRLSTGAMAIAVGVVFGVAASIPTSLLVVAATRGSNRRNDLEIERQRIREQERSRPTVVVVQGQGPPIASQPAQQIWQPRDWDAIVEDGGRRYEMLGDD